ncbi:MAG: hypothetical protein MUE82_02980 [Chloroflexi bacterium]|nr:hypothetical protein [Chloroflexota bacterium]
MSDPRPIPGRLALRPAPPGLPDASPRPPVLAEAGDPFARYRVLRLIARIERGRAVRLDDIVAALNAAEADWLFDRAVVVDALVRLQAAWLSDYRTTTGIVLDDGPYGPTVAIEDTPRVDPWIVRRVARELDACREALAAFSRIDHLGDA